MFGVFNASLINRSVSQLNNFKAGLKQPAKPVGNVKIKTVPASNSSNYNLDKVQGVINKYGNGKSPLTAQDYIKASGASGIPIDALLTQGALESNFGIAGAAVATKNPGNVGNTDSGALEYQKTWYDGLLRQANLLKKEYNYEGGFSADKFMQNDFKRPIGGRYATDPQYGSKYSSILNNVRNLLK